MEGRFNGGFFALQVWGAYIWRGLYMEGLIFGILRYSHQIFIYCFFIVSVSSISGSIFSGMLLGYGNTQCFS